MDDCKFGRRPETDCRYECERGSTSPPDCTTLRHAVYFACDEAGEKDGPTGAGGAGFAAAGALAFFFAAASAAAASFESTSAASVGEIRW